MPRSSSKDATKRQKKAPFKRLIPATEEGMIEHRETHGPVPRVVLARPNAQIGPGHFNRMYEDVIHHCRKLSMLDDE
jgi:hypothetical protein